VSHFPFFHQLGHRSNSLFNGRSRVDSMQVVEIDEIDPKFDAGWLRRTAERSPACRSHRGGWDSRDRAQYQNFVARVFGSGGRE